MLGGRTVMSLVMILLIILVIMIEAWEIRVMMRVTRSLMIAILLSPVSILWCMLLRSLLWFVIATLWLLRRMSWRVHIPLSWITWIIFDLFRLNVLLSFFLICSCLVWLMWRWGRLRNRLRGRLSGLLVSSKRILESLVHNLYGLYIFERIRVAVDY